MNETDAKKRIPRNFSIALGSFEVGPYELARAYSIIAKGGKDVIPFSIRYIKDRNNNVLENIEEEVNELMKEKKKNGTIQIIDPQTAQIMTSMLKTIISSGTGLSASIGRPAGGKTGTTNNWRDAWFVGFSPQLTTCIWMVYDKLGLSLGIGQSGGVVAAPVWARYMKEALKDEPAANFPIYSQLIEREVCALSGLLPSYYCTKVIQEVFTDETVPQYECERCKNIQHHINIHKKGPRQNVAREQMRRVMENIKEKDKEI